MLAPGHPLGLSVYRCKGIVRSAEEPDLRVVLQVVGKRVDQVLRASWDVRHRGTRIGTSLSAYAATWPSAEAAESRPDQST